MKKEEFIKWKLTKYRRHTQYFWLFVLLVNGVLGFVYEGWLGVWGGFILTLIYLFLYSALVGVHPEEKERE